MNTLQGVQDILGKNAKKKEKAENYDILLIDMIEVLGGVEALLQLPLPAFVDIAKGIQLRQKRDIEIQQRLLNGKSKLNRGRK